MAEAAGCSPFETGRGVHLKPEPAPLTASWAHAAGGEPAGARLLDDSPCPPGHNTPFPLERSPPASFWRELAKSRLCQLDGEMGTEHVKVLEECGVRPFEGKVQVEVG